MLNKPVPKVLYEVCQKRAANRRRLVVCDCGGLTEQGQQCLPACPVCGDWRHTVRSPTEAQTTGAHVSPSRVKPGGRATWHCAGTAKLMYRHNVGNCAVQPTGVDRRTKPGRADDKITYWHKKSLSAPAALCIRPHGLGTPLQLSSQERAQRTRPQDLHPQASSRAHAQMPDQARSPSSAPLYLRV